MSATRFFKMTGSGNDFIILDGRESAESAWTPARIAGVCDRRNGVGADGLVMLAPEHDGIRMHYWNADGSRAAMCGNAALCSARLAVRLGLARQERIRLLTDAGPVESRCVGDRGGHERAVIGSAKSDRVASNGTWTDIRRGHSSISDQCRKRATIDTLFTFISGFQVLFA